MDLVLYNQGITENDELSILEQSLEKLTEARRAPIVKYTGLPPRLPQKIMPLSTKDLVTQIQLKIDESIEMVPQLVDQGFHGPSEAPPIDIRDDRVYNAQKTLQPANSSGVKNLIAAHSNTVLDNNSKDQ